MNETPHVFGLATQDLSGREGRATLTTDIIDYIESARTFGRDDLAADDAHGRFQRRLIAVPDQRQPVMTPLVISLTNQNKLVAVRRRQDAAGNDWELIQLGAVFGQDAQVRAVGAAWTDDDRVSLAVSVDDGNLNSPTRIFVAFNLRTKSVDLAAIPWVDCGARPGVRVTGIRLVDNGNRSWTAAFAGSSGPQDNLFLITSRMKQPRFATAPVFDTAVTMDEIFDFETAVHPVLGSGIAVLGTSGGARVLTFRSFPEIDAQGELTTIPAVAVFPCPPGATVLEAESTREDSSTLHIAGAGSVLITGPEMDNAESARLTPVLSRTAAPAIRDLVVADAGDGSASVWTLLQNGDLMVTSRAAGATAFGEPLRLRAQVQEIAPAPGDSRVTTSVLVVYSDGAAAFLFRDVTTKVWTESPLLVANPEGAAAVTVFGTTFRLVDQAGIGRSGLKVKVTASALASVLLNNRTVFLGPDLAVETETLPDGTVSVFDRAQTFTPALYRFAVDGFADHFEGNPAAGIQQQMKAVTADQLRGATTKQRGVATPLLPENLRTGEDRNQVDVLASAMNQAAAVMQTAAAGSPGIRQVSPGSAFGTKLRPDQIPDGFAVGIQADRKGIRAASQQLIQQLTTQPQSVQSFFEGVGRGIADLFESIADGVKDAWAFVLRKVNDVLEVIVQFGNKVLRAVVDTLNEIGSFLENAWNQVKLALEKAWEFLKFLFDWEDILLVRNVMVGSVDASFDFLRKSLPRIRQNISQAFNSLDRQIETWRNEAAGGAPASTPAASGVVSGIVQALAPIQSILELASANPVSSWATNQLSTVASKLVEIKAPDLTAADSQAVESFSQGVFTDQALRLAQTVEQLFGEVAEALGAGLASGGTIDGESIKKALIRLSADTVRTLLAGIRDLIVKALELAEQVLRMVRNFLFSTIRFPFIEELVKLVTGGAVQVDTSFRLVDGLLLLFAVPATLIFKLATGEAPFAKGDKIEFPIGAAVVAQGMSKATKNGFIIGDILSSLIGLVTALVGAISKAKKKGPPIPEVGIALALQSFSLCSQIIGSHPVAGPNFGAELNLLEEIEWGAAILDVIKTFALFVAVEKLGLAGEALERRNKQGAVVDILANAVVILLRFFGYISRIVFAPTSVLQPILNDPADPTTRGELMLSEGLGFGAIVLDKAGGVLFGLAELSEGASVKLAVAGVALKAGSSGLLIGKSVRDLS